MSLFKICFIYEVIKCQNSLSYVYSCMSHDANDASTNNDSYQAYVAVVSIITYIIISAIISYLFQKRQQDSIRCRSWWFDHQTWGCGNSFCCIITDSLTSKNFVSRLHIYYLSFSKTRRKLSSYFSITFYEILSFVSIYDHDL